MYKSLLYDYVIHLTDDVYYAHWKLYKNGSILVVVDENDKFKGIITKSELNKSYVFEDRKYVKDIFNPNCKYLIKSEDTFEKARSIFLDFSYVNQIPILDSEWNLIDIISRQQAFWKKLYDEENLPRMHYAYCIYMAALEASTLGYDSISVLEMGVAGGMGLLNCEFHAKAVARLFGINIDIYGFDLGDGLPNSQMGYKDMVHLFKVGDYKMDFKKLEKRLEKAKLILGNLLETLPSFVMKYTPNPIGAILVDVDYYSSSLPILDFIKKSDSNVFLPRVYMYWDDISPEYEYQGENLAIHEFNNENDNIKISPEKEYYQNYRQKTKICHLFNNAKYNDASNVYIGKGSLKHDSPFFFHELPIKVKPI